MRCAQRCNITEFAFHDYQTILLNSLKAQPKVMRPSQGDAASFHQLLANVW